jgi:ATP-dependent Clp protease protease subunit
MRHMRPTPTGTARPTPPPARSMQPARPALVAEVPGIPGFPRDPRPYPHVPPEIVPSPGPERPFPHPPVPTVWLPGDDLRSQVYEQLLARRTVLVQGPLDAEAASLVAAQLMTLDADTGTTDAGTFAGDAGTGPAPRPVTLVVNSPGGPLDAVAAVLDTVDLMGCPVDTTCLGQAVGTAAVVVAAGTGRRRAGASAQLRLRLPEVSFRGSAARLRDEVEHHRRLHELLIDRLAAATGQERRLVARDVEQGRTLGAEDAVAYGLVEELVTRP